MTFYTMVNDCTFLPLNKFGLSYSMNSMPLPPLATQASRPPRPGSQPPVFGPVCTVTPKSISINAFPANKTNPYIKNLLAYSNPYPYQPNCGKN